MKRMTVIALFTVAALALSGCGAPAADGAPAEAGDSAPPQEAAPADSGADESTQSASLRFVWWGGDARHEATLEVIDRYTQSNPHLQIDGEYASMDGYYQKLTTQFASGTEPDIIQIVPEWFQPLGGDGSGLYPLDDGTIDTAGFDSSYIQANCTIDGRLKALPTGIGGHIMAINVDFMERFGIPVDTVRNWDNLAELGAAVHQQDPEAYLLGGFSGDDATPPGILLKFHVLQQGSRGPWVSDDFQLGFTEEELAGTYRYFLDLLDNGTFQPVEETTVATAPLENTRWLAGNVGMLLAVTSTYSSFGGDILNLDVAGCPIDPEAGDPGFGVTPTQFLIVSANSAAPQEAVKFLQYFFNDPEAIEILQEVRGSQPTTGAAQLLEEAGLVNEVDARAMNICRASSTRFFSMVSVREEFDVPYCDVTNEVLFRRITPEEGAAKMIAQYNEAIDAFRAAGE